MRYRFEPRVMVSRSRGSSVTRAFVIGTPLRAITHSRSSAHAQSRLAHFQSSNLSWPHAFSYAVPTSAYPRHYPGHWLLGGSLPSGHPAWPPAPIAERAVDGLLRSVRPFSVALGRHCTPRLSYRVEYPRIRILRGRVEAFPFFGPACYSRFAGSNSRRLRVFVENPDHSHPFEASPHPASSLSPFIPCTPTFDSQSPAAG
jgi:hypothetical protein